MAFSMGGPQYGLNDAKIADWGTGGVYTNTEDIYSVQLLSVRVETESADLEGDDTITATAIRAKKGTVTLRMGGLSTAVIDKLTGSTLTSHSTGGYATPNQYKRLRINNQAAPYVGICGKALAEEGTGDTHIFIPKCKVAGPFEVRFEINGFTIPEITLTAVADPSYPDANGVASFFHIIEHETAVAVTLPPA